MDAKITLSFDESVINKAKRYAEDNNISLSRLTEFLLNKVTSKNYQSLEDLPISDWVSMVSEGQATYHTKARKSKDLKNEFFKSKKMRLFLDANILVALLNKEYPLFTYAARIVSLADNKNFKVYTSPVCLAIAFYFAEKKSGTQMAKKKITLLAEKLFITNTGKEEVLQALQNKKVNDFEDGLEYYSAMHSKCDVIISEDLNDFYFLMMPVFTSKAFLEKHLF